MNITKYFRWLSFKTITKPKEHEHDWIFQYRTGNPFDGKSEVYKCSGCNKMAVRHSGQKDKILID